MCPTRSLPAGLLLRTAIFTAMIAMISPAEAKDLSIADKAQVPGDIPVKNKSTTQTTADSVMKAQTEAIKYLEDRLNKLEKRVQDLEKKK